MKKVFLFLSLLVVVMLTAGCTKPSVEGITITSEGNVRTIKVEQTLQLTAKVFPENTSQEVVWESSNDEKASVSETGLVTALSEGTVEIIAKSSVDANVKQSYSLIIEKKDPVVIQPTSVTINARITTCKAGESLSLSATVLPEGASQSVEWSSSNLSVATISNGTVSALSEGTVEITVNPKGYADIKATVTLTIEAAEAEKTWETMEYSTHAEYMSAANDELLKVKGVVTYVCPVKNGKVNYYVSNGKEGYYVYGQDANKYPVELGKVYEIGGYKKYYNGLMELVNVGHLVELNEEITYESADLTGLDPTNLEQMNLIHCSIVEYTATLSEVPADKSKAFSFYASVNGHSTTFRVDPAYMSAEEFAKLCSMLSLAVSGTSFEFKGYMSAFGYGKASPQINIVSSEGVKFPEVSTEELLEAAANGLEISSSVAMLVNEIELPTIIESIEGLTITWSSNSASINVETGAVTHSSENETVTLTATLTLNGQTKEVEFEVLVFALDNAEYEVVASLDLEDAAAAGSYGTSDTKSGYAEGNINLGTPKHNWMLRNALIGGSSGDRYEGSLSIRAQVGKTAEATARIELLDDVEFSVLEFAACLYGSDAAGIQIRVEYSTDSGETWAATDGIITISSSELEVYRVNVPEGANRVAIVLV